MSSVPRSATLAAWAGSWLAGGTGLDEVFAHLAERDDAVDAVDEDGTPVSLHRVLARLQAIGVTRLQLVLPVPGDPRGLPAGTPFAVAALAAGEAVLAVPPAGDAYGLVPEVTTHGTELEGTVTTVTWQVHRAPAPVGEPLPELAAAAAELRDATLAAAGFLAQLAAVRWRPELGAALDAWRREGRRGHTDGSALPPDYPAEARTLLTQAGVLDAVLDLVLAEDSGADAQPVDADQRAEALRPVRSAVRRARCAAISAGPVTAEAARLPTAAARQSRG